MTPEELGDKLAEELNKLPNYILEVGVFSDDDERDEKGNLKPSKSYLQIGVSNAELMFIHENGSPLQNIPSRPVLHMTVDYANENLLNRTIQKAIAAFIQSNFDKKAFEAELNKMATRVEKYARQLIYSNDGRLAPNSPSTIKRKGDNHPLFDTGQLARSITCRVIKL